MTHRSPAPQAKASIGRLDVAVALAVVTVGTLLMAGNVYEPEEGVDVSFAAIPAFLLVTVPVLWRSVAPLPALGAVVAGLLVHTAAFGEVVRCGATFPALGLLAFAAGARLDGRDAALALAVGVAGVLIASAGELLGFGVAGVGVPLVVIAWALGRVAHSRGRMAVELRRRNEELRRARDERARLEVGTDRARLSRDLDELLERRLDDLARLAERGPASLGDGTASTLLAEIEQTSRATLDDMRELVGVLRSDDGAAAVAPQPTLTSLDALVMRTKGADAQLTVDGSLRALPAGVELSAYRVVEHLLDALDDAPGVEVRVHFADDALELVVQGPARRRGGEVTAAIARARERVELHRGTLTARTRDGQARAVAELPLAGVT